jgi:hypothetical protein
MPDGTEPFVLSSEEKFVNASLHGLARIRGLVNTSPLLPALQQNKQLRGLVEGPTFRSALLLVGSYNLRDPFAEITDTKNI